MKREPSWVDAGRAASLPAIIRAVQLLQRTIRGIALTEVGDAFLARAPPTAVARTAALLIGQIARRRNADEWLRRNVPLPEDVDGLATAAHARQRHAARATSP